MTRYQTLSRARAFFYANAGYSHTPGVETAEQGRARGARELAHAELEASERGYSCQWSIDRNTTSADWRDDVPAYEQWDCLCRNPAGEVVGSCGGIDFGPGVEPWGEPYRRVMEAELTLEALTERNWEPEPTAA